MCRNVPDDQDTVAHILGYLNFSSGAEDSRFIAAMSSYFTELTLGRDPNPGSDSVTAAEVADQPPGKQDGSLDGSLDGGSVPENADRQMIGERTTEQGPAGWQVVLESLSGELAKAREQNPAFLETAQAETLLGFLEDFIPEYLSCHNLLLSHHSPDDVFTGFFLARLMETTLTCYARNEGRLNFQLVRSDFDDYIGFRPVAVLESRKLEPYSQEFTRPIPIYIRGVGSANGRYQPFVDYAIKMISEAPKEVLFAAQFDLESLDEIAIDPRAYDFEHPVNKRPNYHFGQWDPHKLDLSGYFRRFVVQQVTLDALASRCEVDEVLKPEMIHEAGAVLAGTILMAASICGRSPDSFDSNTSIAQLLPRIARMRDQFYQWLLSTIGGKHGQRLLEESGERRQPFGGARQHLNGELANLRETQLETVRLAGIYARMGYSVAAMEQSTRVQVASARIRTQVECCLTDAEQLIRQADYENAYLRLLDVFDLLKQGIGCGALIDPWNILGFDAQFSLFPAMENTVQDERAHYLVEIITHLFAAYSTLWSHAAAQDDEQLCFRIRESFEQVTEWWHPFAAHEVGNVDAPNGKEMLKAAEQVATAMNLWHKMGSEAGNVAFWAEHANLFGKPRAYELIINALLEKDDLATSMALIMHWLSQAETVGLESSDSSFHFVVEQWAYRIGLKALDEYRSGRHEAATATLQQLIRKFMDFLEVNAESYWQVPGFSLGDKTAGETDVVIEDEPDEIYGAAYEDVVYRDSTDDGFDGPVFETDDGRVDGLEFESRRIEDRLRFHETVARIWETVAPVFA